MDTLWSLAGNVSTLNHQKQGLKPGIVDISIMNITLNCTFIVIKPTYVDKVSLLKRLFKALLYATNNGRISL